MWVGAGVPEKPDIVRPFNDIFSILAKVVKYSDSGTKIIFKSLCNNMQLEPQKT
jgi:hypothetical protein